MADTYSKITSKRAFPAIFFYVFFLLLVCGCAPAKHNDFLVSNIKPGGIYHRVQKGETLWSISQKYSVEIDELMSLNMISQNNRIEVDQQLLIPAKHVQNAVIINKVNEGFIWPLRGNVVGTFGDNFNNMVSKGINIQPTNTCDVLASRSGKVVFYADSFLSFGKTLIIEHEDGFLTVYTGNSQVYVKVGDVVKQGHTIAMIQGAVNNKKVCLHFEIRKGYIPKNPYFYLPS